MDMLRGSAIVDEMVSTRIVIMEGVTPTSRVAPGSEGLANHLKVIEAPDKLRGGTQSAKTGFGGAWIPSTQAGKWKNGRWLFLKGERLCSEQTFLHDLYSFFTAELLSCCYAMAKRMMGTRLSEEVPQK